MSAPRSTYFCTLILALLPLAQLSSSSSSRRLRALQERWLSIKAQDLNNVGEPYITAWPATCTNPMRQPIRYCYYNRRSYNNLHEIVQGAINNWARAMHSSSLLIIPDPKCTNRDECICLEHGAATDALVIRDMTKDGDLQYNQSEECYTETTVGYEYIAPNEPDSPWRHQLKFCNYDRLDPLKTIERAIRDMTHEKGHAAGLLHEHQRTDRDEHIIFNCKNLRGYEEAKELAEEDPAGVFEEEPYASMDIEARMVVMCNNGHFAMTYFPDAVEFLRTDQFGGTEMGPRYATTQMSTTFDRESIMLYESSMASLSTSDWVLTFRKRFPNDPEEVFIGNDEDPGLATISRGDIARIAMLYDAQTEDGEIAKGGGVEGREGEGEEWGAMRPMRMKVRGGEWKEVKMLKKRGKEAPRALEMEAGGIYIPSYNTSKIIEA